MAQFIGEVKGRRSAVSRLGSKASGMWASARGWDIGGDIEMRYDESLKTDVVSIYVTGGSNGHPPRRLVGKFMIKNGKYKKL